MRLGADGAAFCRNILLFDEDTSLSSSAKGLAGRYAGALYALAEESGKIDAVVKDMNGVAELRVKETDRIKVMADGLMAAGADVRYDDDTMTVTGSHIAGGMTVDSQHDHRIAMSFLTLGLISEAPVSVDGCETINTSFPNFAAIMKNAGANIATVNS